MDAESAAVDPSHTRQYERKLMIPALLAEEDDFREQKLAWIQQQNEIANQVVVVVEVVLPDDLDSLATQTANHQQRFSQIDMNDGMVRLGKNHNDDQMTAETSCNNTTMYFGGVDVSFPENTDNNEDEEAVAVYVILEYPTFRVVYCETEYFALTVPYIPGFLAFREVEPLHRLVTTQLLTRPDLTPRAILVDGNGVWHCRHAGLACFLGVQTGIPSIGIGKTLYYHAGWTKERVSQVVWGSVSSAVEENLIHNNSIPRLLLPPLQQQGSEAFETSTITATSSSSASSKREGKVLSVLLFDRNVAKSPTKEEEKDVISSDENAASSKRRDNREVLIQELSCFCDGLAIPLQGQREPDDDNEETDLDPTNSHHSRPYLDGVGQRIMACALVGHGGGQQRQNHTNRIHSSSLSRRRVSVNPIFISVGHKLSLPQAVLISAALSLTRIPEPIRQADKIGREMLRNKKTTRER